MTPFMTVTAVAAPLDEANVDADQILPAEFLRRPRSDGYAKFLFHRRRFDSDGRERADFVLNQAAFRPAQILIADANFGCGSSHESAVWALVDPPEDPVAPGRFRALIAPSFGDIFLENAARNGLLCARLPPEVCSKLRAELWKHPGAVLTIDLPSQVVTEPNGSMHRFEIDPFRKSGLLNARDDIALTLECEGNIQLWERRARTTRPWIMR